MNNSYSITQLKAGALAFADTLADAQARAQAFAVGAVVHDADDGLLLLVFEGTVYAVTVVEAEVTE